MCKKIISIFFLFYSFVLYAQKPEVVLTTGHTDFISSISISPDAKLIATGGLDKLVKLNDIATGRELRTFAGNNGRVNETNFDKTGKYVAASLYSDEIKIWEISTGNTISTFNASSHSPGFDFCLNNTKIAYLDSDSKLCTKDWMNNSEPTIIDESGFTRIKLNKDDSTLFGYDYKGVLKKISLNTGKVIQSTSLFDKFIYSPCKMDIDEKGEFLAIAFADNVIRIYNTKDLKLYAELKGFEKVINNIKFDQKSQSLIVVDYSNYIRVWDVKQKKEVEKYSVTTFAPTAIAVHPKQKVVLINDGKIVLYLKQNTGEVLRTFKSKSNKVINMAYDQQGKYIASATDDITIKLWNLKENKIDKVLTGFFPCEFDPSGKYLATMGNTISLTVWDVASGESAYTLDTEYELIQNLSYSKDGKYLSGAGFNGIVKIWDTESRKLIKKFTGHVGGIYATCFSPDGKFLASAGMDQTIRIWEFATGQEIKKMEGHTIIVSDVKFSPDGKILASSSWDKTIKLWNTSTWDLINTLEGHTNMITSISFNKEGNIIASASGNNSVWTADNTVKVWDVSTGKELCSYNNHVGTIHKVIFDKTSDLVFSSGDDGMIKIWNYKDCIELASLISVYSDDYVILSPDNYYTASRDALAGVSFRIGADLYPFEQFDLRLNRPDIIASKIGKTPEGLINAYNYVYRKRLKKMGFEETDLGKDFFLPKLSVNSDELPLITKDDKIKVNIKANDDNFNLNRLNVYVNDVPLFGINGIDLKTKNTKSIDLNIDIKIIPGPNKIQISVLNEKGIESLRSTFDIIKDDPNNKGDLYIIAIGVSNYKNSKFSLTYPVKDATDLVNELKANKDLFTKTHAIIISDSIATKENIAALSDTLKNSKIEDVVIFFIAGHGVLDKNFDYYYGTYDMDFNNPKERGLSYDELDKLIGNIAALKKILIMDTCHSGELDKDEIEESKEEKTEGGDVEFRAAGIGVREKPGFGMTNSTNLMQNLFSNIRRGSGITVISSAGGAEYAMEGDQWKNGLFTYCMLEGMRTKSADKNWDGKIIISELREYVYKKVTKLSNGKQKPTSREDNLTLDYQIR